MSSNTNTVTNTGGNIFSSLSANSREQHDEQAVSGAARQAVLIPDDTVLKVRCLTTLSTPTYIVPLTSSWLLTSTTHLRRFSSFPSIFLEKQPFLISS
jgi:hypothetical protein